MKLTQQQLEAHLWGAANILRGKTAGQDYKNYILSLMFYKRLCDQWENEAEEAIAELERQQGRLFTEKQRALFRARGEHRFSIPSGSRWGDILTVSENIGEKLTDAMRAVSNANDELRGVFTVDWNQPAPDGSGKKLIPNEVVHALIQHFDEIDLSNRSVPPDVLGRAYEYLIKQFADDAGAKAGEFFTPPEVVDTLVRILEPQPGDTIYDPTCGSGGMLIHSADFLRENGHSALSARYFGQEMNWGNFAIGKINSVLHGLEADIKGGVSTITDPQFLEDGQVKKFSLVLANFPFSDEFWWLKPEQQTDDKKKKEKLKKEIFGKEGFKDTYGRFGRGTAFKSPPPGYGDYAFILHILASLTETGRAGIVCPQGILFRGQPEVEEETVEFNGDGPIIKRRKADDEHLIRQALLESRYIDAVFSLPLNVFYGAGVPACLLILRKNRSVEKRHKVLLVYAARHYRELSNQTPIFFFTMTVRLCHSEWQNYLHNVFMPVRMTFVKIFFHPGCNFFIFHVNYGQEGWSRIMIKCHLSRLMGERKLKIADLAREIGVHRNTISLLYYEKAQRIDFEVLDRLCKYFDCTAGDLLEYKE